MGSLDVTVSFDQSSERCDVIPFDFHPVSLHLISREGSVGRLEVLLFVLDI